LKTKPWSSSVALVRQILPSASLALHLKSVRTFVQAADALFREALLEGRAQTEQPEA
jgi:hypothetical protein